MSAFVKIESLLGEPKPNYQKIWDLQHTWAERIAKREAPEGIIFCEHEPLLTLGRRAKSENILAGDLPLYEIERGGDVTYHGPGQLVIYPLIRLNGENFPEGIHSFLRLNEKVLIHILKNLGLEAGTYGPTGVWVTSKRDRKIRKIASLGIAVRRWVSYHGMAVNVTNDPKDFAGIRPCDFDSSIMTSLAVEGVLISLSEMKSLLEVAYLEAFSQLRNHTLVGKLDLTNQCDEILRISSSNSK